MAMKSLSGEVNQVSSNVSGSVASNTRSYTASVVNNDSPVYYNGSETSSLKLNVDNSTRTISGEVKWQNMIAMNELEEDAYHAYPANKAKIAFTQLRAELESLQSIIDNLDASCTSSAQIVGGYVEDLTTVQQELEKCRLDLVTLNGYINQEKLTREQEDLKIKQTQAKALESLNSEMSQLVSTTQQQLRNQDAILDRNSEAISSESERAKTEELKLDNKIQSVIKAVNFTNKNLGETDARVESFNKRLNSLENININGSLQDQSKLIEDVSSVVAELKTQSSVDIGALKENTSALTDVVYKNSSKISELDGLLKHTKDIIECCEDNHVKQSADIENLKRKHDHAEHVRDEQYTFLTNSVVGEADVRRSTDELHEQEMTRLEKRISSLQENMYNIVHGLGEELRQRDQELQDNILNVSYSFIDGGNAPI